MDDSTVAADLVLAGPWAAMARVRSSAASSARAEVVAIETVEFAAAVVPVAEAAVPPTVVDAVEVAIDAADAAVSLVPAGPPTLVAGNALAFDDPELTPASRSCCAIVIKPAGLLADGALDNASAMVPTIALALAASLLAMEERAATMVCAVFSALAVELLAVGEAAWAVVDVAAWDAAAAGLAAADVVEADVVEADVGVAVFAVVSSASLASCAAKPLTADDVASAPRLALFSAPATFLVSAEVTVEDAEAGSADDVALVELEEANRSKIELVMTEISDMTVLLYGIDYRVDCLNASKQEPLSLLIDKCKYMKSVLNFATQPLP